MSTLLLCARSELGRVTIRRCGARHRLLAYLGAMRFDRALAGGASPDSSVTISLRAQALIGLKARRRLSRSLSDLVQRAKEPAYPIRGTPLCRQKIVAAEDLLEQTARRLIAGGPVDARGVAQILLLLTDGGSPVYDNPQADDLRPALCAATRALELRV